MKVLLSMAEVIAIKFWNLNLINMNIISDTLSALQAICCINEKRNINIQIM